MKLDFLTDGSPECPLLRLHDFTSTEAGHLLVALSSLANEATDRIEVHRLPFVEPVGGCRASFVRGTRDQGVAQVAPLDFVCGFTVGTWENVVGLIRPCVNSSPGFQWLAGLPGEASLLLSASGQW
jgi:hypothetical protein